MKKLIQKLRDGLEDWLRKLCGKITPDKRVIAIAVLMVLFAALNIWITFRAIYNIGREDARMDVIEITPIHIPDFDLDGQEPSELQQGIEEYFKQNFNTEDNDTTDIEQGQTEP